MNKEIEELKNDLEYCIYYDEWTLREYGEYHLDTDITAYNLHNKGYRKELNVAKEILTAIGNISDDDDRFKLKDYQWFQNLCKKYKVEVH